MSPMSRANPYPSRAQLRRKEAAAAEPSKADAPVDEDRTRPLPAVDSATESVREGEPEKTKPSAGVPPKAGPSKTAPPKTKSPKAESPKTPRLQTEAPKSDAQKAPAGKAQTSEGQSKTEQSSKQAAGPRWKALATAAPVVPTAPQAHAEFPKRVDAKKKAAADERKAKKAGRSASETAISKGLAEPKSNEGAPPSNEGTSTEAQKAGIQPVGSRRSASKAKNKAAKAIEPRGGAPAKQLGAVPERKSIRQRMAEKQHVSASIVDSAVDNLSTPSDTTASFRVDVTGALVPDEFAPVPVETERSEPQGELDPQTASAYHLLALPDDVSPEDLEALTVSVWNEAGWLGPGVLRLREGTTLEGPWLVGEQREELGLPEGVGQVWRLVCPPHRGAPPVPEVAEFDVWAKAFPEGMPVGSELGVLQVLSRVARRLGGSMRIAGSGYVITPNPEAAVNLRVFSDTWLPPLEAGALLEAYLPGIHAPQPLPEGEGDPYAFLAPAGNRSQVLVGVREETFLPRAMRWELWSKGTQVYVYELVWAPPDDLMGLEVNPTRSGLAERRRVLTTVETAAAALVTALPQAAIIDEDGFLLALDEPHPEEEPQHL